MHCPRPGAARPLSPLQATIGLRLIQMSGNVPLSGNLTH